MLYESDWLSSDPIFYNEKTAKISRNINDVIDFRNLEFDAEGLTNYLNFGYSVLEHTPVKHVKFLRHSSTLSCSHEKGIEIKYLQDPVENLINNTADEKKAIRLLQQITNSWETSISGDIVIPTSGGFDSRLLNLLVKDKSRIHAFTYGISKDQTKSYEVVYAQKLAEQLNIKWEQIQLGKFHNYIDEWISLFGVSTHAHGMYHMEFYNSIIKKVKPGSGLLSGIIGDAWAGSLSIDPIKNPDDVLKLGYSHNVHADASQCLIKSENSLVQNYYDQNRYKLDEPRYRIVESMRMKIILLCYLLRVPGKIGFLPWSPFLDIEVAIEMLNLRQARRSNRLWQMEYFKQHNLDLENMNLTSSKKNTLDKQAIQNIPLKPLNRTSLREIIRPEYIDWINKNISSSNSPLDKLITTPKLGSILKRMGLEDTVLKAYNAYLTIKPIELLIEKRNKA